MPKAKISFITRSRYSLTFGISWIGIRRRRSAFWKLSEEAPGEREDEVVGQRGAEQEQDRGGQQERQQRALLAAVQARGDEQPKLDGDHREGNERAAEERDFDLGEERLVELGVYQMRVGIACCAPARRRAVGRGSSRSALEK